MMVTRGQTATKLTTRPLPPPPVPPRPSKAVVAEALARSRRGYDDRGLAVPTRKAPPPPVVDKFPDDLPVNSNILIAGRIQRNGDASNVKAPIAPSLPKPANLNLVITKGAINSNTGSESVVHNSEKINSSNNQECEVKNCNIIADNQRTLLAKEQLQLQRNNEMASNAGMSLNRSPRAVNGVNVVSSGVGAQLNISNKSGPPIAEKPNRLVSDNQISSFVPGYCIRLPTVPCNRLTVSQDNLNTSSLTKVSQISNVNINNAPSKESTKNFIVNQNKKVLASVNSTENLTLEDNGTFFRHVTKTNSEAQILSTDEVEPIKVNGISNENTSSKVVNIANISQNLDGKLNSKSPTDKRDNCYKDAKENKSPQVLFAAQIEIIDSPMEHIYEEIVAQPESQQSKMAHITLASDICENMANADKRENNKAALNNRESKSKLRRMPYVAVLPTGQHKHDNVGGTRNGSFVSDRRKSSMRSSSEESVETINTSSKSSGLSSDSPLVEDLVMELSESFKLREQQKQDTKIQHSNWVKVEDSGEQVRYSSCNIMVDGCPNQRTGTYAVDDMILPDKRKQKSRSMASLQGLPPLPKSLSGINLLEGTGSSSGLQPLDTAPRRPPPPPPPHAPRSRKPQGLDAQLAILRKEMFGLRQLDLSLLSQLWSLNESIQEFRQLLQEQEENAALSPPSPSSAEEGEEFYSPLPRYHATAIQRKSVPEKYHLTSSSSQSSIEFGDV